MMSKEERERQEVEEKKRRVGDTMAVLDWQKETRAQAKQQEKQLTDIEREMLNQQWRNEEDREREMERQRFVLNKERNLELLRHNDAEKALREEQLKLEKERDKDMLGKAITKEQQIERLEMEEKLRRRQEVVDL